MGASAARDADARLHLAIPVHTTVGSRRVLDPKRSNCAVCTARFVPLLRGKHYCRRCGDIVCEACTSLRTYGSRLPPPPPPGECGRDGSASPRRHRQGDACSSPPRTQPSSPNTATPPPQPTDQSDDSNPPSSPNMNCSSASPDRCASSSSKPMPVKFRVCTPCNLRQSAVNVLPQACWERIVTFAGDVAHHHVLQTCRRLQLVANLPYPTGSGWDTFFGESTFLAKGANGAVYRAQLHSHIAAKLGLTGGSAGSLASQAPTSSPLVAVKVINKSTVLSLRKWRHVVREIDAMQQCRHPNVLRLLGVFQTPEAVYVVGELAPGGDVFDWLVAKRGCTESEAKGVMKQLLVALQHMHDNVGAVHRDVKPENLFLLEKAPHSQQQQQQRGHNSHRRIPAPAPSVLRRGAVPAIVLGDFGYARVFPESANPRRPPIGVTASAAMPIAGAQAARAEMLNRELTAKATPCGTLGFAPPEVLQAYADRKATPSTAPAAPITPVDIMKKTDVFAAGVTMCLLLTATEPFPCHSSAANVAAVQRGVDFTGRHWSHVSSGARSLIQRMLAPSAEQRPSAYDCLASPWFASVRSEPLPSAVQPLPLASTAVAAQQQQHLRGGGAFGGECERPSVDLSSSARSLRKNAGVYAPIGITTGRRSSRATAASSSTSSAIAPSTAIANAAVAAAVSPAGEAEVLRLSREEIERQDRALDRQLSRRALTTGTAATAAVPAAAQRSPPSPSLRGSRSSGGGGSPTTVRHPQAQELDCFE